MFEASFVGVSLLIAVLLAEDDSEYLVAIVDEKSFESWEEDVVE